MDTNLDLRFYQKPEFFLVLINLIFCLQIMQFGLMVFFLPAFPLAALFSLINNIIEIRSDAFKMCLLFQRPFGQRVANIGNIDMEQQNFCFEFKA